jgi:hypothetical protein
MLIVTALILETNILNRIFFVKNDIEFDVHKSVHLQIYSLSTTNKMSIFSIYLFQ